MTQQEDIPDDVMEIDFGICDDLMGEIHEDMECMTQEEVVQNMVTAIVHPSVYLMKMGMSEESLVAIYSMCLVSLEVYFLQQQAANSGKTY
jgi:hypothetical protein